MFNREQVEVALFELLRNTPGLRSASRRLKHWTDVSDADKPSLFLSKTTEQAASRTRIETVWQINFDVTLYVKIGGGSDVQAPATIYNPIVDAIAAQIEPSTGMEGLGEQTLGGLVHKCRVDGTIQTDEGVLGDEAVVVIPIAVLVPA